MVIPLLIALPVAAGIIAQVLKFGIAILTQRENPTIAVKQFLSYGGMPSAHAAFIVSLMVAIGLWEGFTSPLFALSFVVTVIIIRDAVGLRQYLSKHGVVLNRLVRDLPNERERTYPKLEERIGHTGLEATVGSIIGALVSVLGYAWFS